MFKYKSWSLQRVVFKSAIYQVHSGSTFPDMGQRFSALRKRRKASKRNQSPSTLNEPTNEILSQEDDYTITSSYGLEISHFNSNDTSSEALPPTPELETETVPTTLPRVCSELILDIAEYLPPSSQMSLSYTCRVLRSKMGVSFAQVLGYRDPKGQLSGSKLSIESRNIRFLERLELWSMLVRDREISLWRASFSGYHTKFRYDYSMVETPLYTPISTEHRCVGAAGLLWVCPHRTLDYKNATMERETNDSHRCGKGWISLSSPPSHITIMWSIMRIPANSVPTSEEVVEALRPLNAPICPHMRLNDASVARIYDPKCSNKNWDDPAPACRCSVCLSGGPLPVICSYCNTSLGCNIQPNRSSRAKFCLFIMRTTRFGRSCIDRDWIAQVARPDDLEDYKRAWEATNAECSRRLGSRFDR